MKLALLALSSLLLALSSLLCSYLSLYGDTQLSSQVLLWVHSQTLNREIFISVVTGALTDYFLSTGDSLLVLSLERSWRHLSL